jgi:deoxyribodipyrimidine photo-lyase
VVVFTRDLRVRDNPALATACLEAEEIVPLFVIDETITSSAGANRTGFLSDSLRDLDDSLRHRGGRLVLRRGHWVDEVLAVAQSMSAGAVHLAADVSGLAQRRTDGLRRAAAAAGLQIHEHPGITVVPPRELQPAGGGEYKVFTAHHRRWLAARWRDPAEAPSRVDLPQRLGSPEPDCPGVERLDQLLGGAVKGRRSPNVIVGGESEGRRRVDAFAAEGVTLYHDRRDRLADDATSRMSAFLHFGCLSPLEVATQLLPRPGGDATVRQLCWRDFFHQMLAARPDAAHTDYRPARRSWNEDAEAFGVWCEGRTGYPLVDAAMRQLRREGFMHNRARMVVASFLCKDLYMDWRLGAAHFMSLLVDGISPTTS